MANAPVTLPGFDPTRTDNDPKYAYGRFAQQWLASGKPWGGDAVRAFVAQDPRWEIDPNSSKDDPRIRVKQAELDKWKPGTSIWQETIRDSGPGGANAVQFINAGGTTPPATMHAGSSWFDQVAPSASADPSSAAVTAPLVRTAPVSTFTPGPLTRFMRSV